MKNELRAVTVTLLLLLAFSLVSCIYYVPREAETSAATTETAAPTDATTETTSPQTTLPDPDSYPNTRDEDHTPRY